MVNLHFSRLPRWRGAAPVERAILAGDEMTGVCVMQVAEGLDTGDVYACVDVPIGPRSTAAELRRELVTAGTSLLVDELREGLSRPTPQVGEPTYAAKITPEELRIDWSRPAVELDRLVRVGGAWTTWRGSRIKVIEAAIVEGRLVPTVVQPEGRRPMAYVEWRRGARPTDGEWFE
jgi:methionyl-tRNA formyltransferase